MSLSFLPTLVCVFLMSTCAPGPPWVAPFQACMSSAGCMTRSPPVSVPFSLRAACHPPAPSVPSWALRYLPSIHHSRPPGSVPVTPPLGVRDVALHQLLTILALVEGYRFSNNGSPPSTVILDISVFVSTFSSSLSGTQWGGEKLIQSYHGSSWGRFTWGQEAGMNFSLVSFVITNIRTWVSTTPWHMPLRVPWYNLSDVQGGFRYVCPAGWWRRLPGGPACFAQMAELYIECPVDRCSP